MWFMCGGVDLAAASLSAHMPQPYAQLGNAAFESQLVLRTAAQSARFIGPFLRPGMRVLDAGCGPGSITLGLAAAVAPGEVVGVDLQASQVDRARTVAGTEGITNVRFEVGDVYALPFPDGSFDVVFAHALLMHVRDPVRALLELRRLLGPGGVVGVRDPDLSATVLEPTTPTLERYRAMRRQVQAEAGQDPSFVRHYRRLLLEAGFGRTTARATADSAGTLEETRRHAAFLAAQLHGLARNGHLGASVDDQAVHAFGRELELWGERDDAFCAWMWYEAIGWTAG